MLRSLHISHYVLIGSLDVSFPEGLVIITGQTGAGKSILLGALSLALGAKADASVISPGADSCVVEAEFSTGDPAVEELLREADVETDAGGILLIRRVVSSSGRSRSFINDCPVTVQLLSALSSHLIDIHSQHQSLLLTDKAFQLSVLDHFAGNSARLESCREAYRELLRLRDSLASTRERLSRLSEERDYNTARFETLEKARIRDGELEELEQQQRRLANSGEIKEALEAARSLLEGPEGQSVPAALKDASRHISKAARFVPGLEPLSGRLDSARIELEDILSEVESADERTPVSEDALAAVEERMAMIYDLFTRYSCRTEAELLEKKEAYERALFDSTALEDEAAALEKAVSAQERLYEGICAELSESRSKAAPQFAGAITESLRFLELESAVFGVCLSPAKASAVGTDAVNFLFSASGGDPVDVAKCASGGEISRIMLCLKAMLARFKGMPTMVFDEIDTGVSGSAADRMGQMICSMGRDMQVVAITHLPQVAAKGDAHFLVTKDESGSGLHLLDRDGRVLELARLLSGSRITPEAVANAESLLKEASSRQ